MTVKRPKPTPEAMAHHVLPQLAAKADLDKAVIDLEKTIGDTALRLMIAMVAVAGLALAITKAL